MSEKECIEDADTKAMLDAMVKYFKSKVLLETMEEVEAYAKSNQRFGRAEVMFWGTVFLTGLLAIRVILM